MEGLRSTWLVLFLLCVSFMGSFMGSRLMAEPSSPQSPVNSEKHLVTLEGHQRGAPEGMDRRGSEVLSPEQMASLALSVRKAVADDVARVVKSATANITQAINAAAAGEGEGKGEGGDGANKKDDKAKSGGVETIALKAGDPHLEQKGSQEGVSARTDTVLILSPMHNAVGLINGRFFKNLLGLTYPKHLISLAFLVANNGDGTWEALQAKCKSLEGQYRHIQVIEEGHGSNAIAGEQRHNVDIQFSRRSNMARIRNTLLVTALRDEQWVLWLDADVLSYPGDMLDRLLIPGKSVIVPHIVMPEGRTYDLNSWQETDQSREMQKRINKDDVLYEGYAGRPTYRLHMGELQQRGKDLVELDGVGGAVLLVRADLHRGGLIFPTFPFEHQVETEALGKMAIAMGHRPWGITSLRVLHA